MRTCIAAVPALAALLLAASPVPNAVQKGGRVSRNRVLEGYLNAPEFPSHLAWLNTDRPLTLRELRGKLVLLDFWTFCCINCMHIIPDLKRLEEKYSQELVVIGVHSAKFTNEKDTTQIRSAILRYGIRHPVINDHNFEVWQSYGAHSWPTLVLINPNGKIIGTHAGEGIFEPFDAAIGQAVRYFEEKGELKRGPLQLSLEETSRPDTLLSFPGKISADASKRLLYISDSGHNRIVVTGPDGAIQDAIGSGKPGLRDGPFEEAEFRHPQGATAVGDVLYIADTENHAIRAADFRTRNVITVLGTGRQAMLPNVAGRGKSVDLSSPWDLLVHDGKLYIAMAGTHQLWVADLKTWEAAPYAGSAREARIDGPLREAALAQPSGIATDGESLYFADSESSSIRAAGFGAGASVRTLIGEDLFEFGDKDGGRHKARLQHPLGVLFQNGLLYIADTYNSKVKIVDPRKNTSTTYAGTGKHGYVDGKPESAQFNEPGGLAALDGNLYVADTNNHQVRIIDPKAREVRTMELSNLEKLARFNERRFGGRSVELPTAYVRAGGAHLTIGLNLPAGYKLSPGAPFYIDWKSSDERAIRFQSTPKDFDLHDPRFPIEVLLVAAQGKSELTVDAVVYYCTEQSTACFVDPVRLKVPVQVEPQGPATLNVSVPVRVPK